MAESTLPDPVPTPARGPSAEGVLLAASAAARPLGALLATLGPLVALEFAGSVLASLAEAKLPPGTNAWDPSARVIRAAQEGLAAIRRAMDLGIITPQPGDDGALVVR